MAAQDDKYFPLSDPPPTQPGANTNKAKSESSSENEIPNEWVETSKGKESPNKGALSKLRAALEKEKHAPTSSPNQPSVQGQSIPNQQDNLHEAVVPGQIQPTDQSSQSQLAKSVKPPLPKKGMPKSLIIALGAFVILLVVALIIFIVKPGKPPLVGRPGELTWWGYQYDEDVVQPLIDEYQQANPTVKITYVRKSERDYRERLTNVLAAGTGPDIFEIHNSWVPMYINDLAPLPASIMSKEDYENSFYPVLVSDLSKDKGIVAMPLEYDALTLFINEDIFASAFQKPPVTWDDLRSLVSTDTEGSLTIIGDDKQISQSGVALGETENVDYWPDIIALMMYQNGVDPARPTDDKAAAVLGFFSFFRSNKVWSKDLPTSTIFFTQGKLAMFFAPSRVAAELQETSPNLKFRTVRLPQLPKNDPTEPDFSYATYWVQGVWERSRNQELAWEFLKYLSTPDNLKKLNQNIKEATDFNRAYPRPDMNEVFKEDEILGSVVSMARDAKSWYLAGNTNDGETGINSQLAKVYSTILENWKPTSKADDRALIKNAPEIRKILSQFGIR